MKVLAFKERTGCPGGGKGILIAEDMAFTLATNFNGAICYDEQDESICNREPSERQPCNDRQERDSSDPIIQNGNRREQHAVCPHYFYESRYAEWKPYSIASVRESGGSCGNGSEGVVCSCVCDGDEPLECPVY